MSVQPPLPDNAFSRLGTTIFSVMSALALEHNAVNLGQGFPDEDGPLSIREAAARALIDGPNPSEVEVTTETLRLATPHGEQILERSTVLDHTYVDWGAVVRS